MWLAAPRCDQDTSSSYFYDSANNNRRTALCFLIVSQSVRSHLFRVTRFLFSYWRDFNETWHTYSSCEWALPKMLSRSEVKDQRHSEVRQSLLMTQWSVLSGVQWKSPLVGIAERVQGSSHALVRQKDSHQLTDVRPLCVRRRYILIDIVASNKTLRRGLTF